jgi:hypothetical protein
VLTRRELKRQFAVIQLPEDLYNMNALTPNHWKRIRRIVLLGGTLSLFATASFASIITSGTFTLSGSIFVTGAGIAPVVTPAGTCPAGIQCIFFADNAGTANLGDIAPFGLPSGSPPNPIPASIAGAGAANLFPQFNPPEIPPNITPPVALMSFNNPGGTITTVLMLYSFPLGTNGTTGCPPPIGVGGGPCTVPGSPFNLQDIGPNQSIVSFTMGGLSADKTASWSGTFTSQFNNMSYEQVLAQLAANGFVSNTFSGQVTLSPIPEPGSLSFLLLGGGMIASATLLRRISRR